MTHTAPKPNKKTPLAALCVAALLAACLGGLAAAQSMGDAARLGRAHPRPLAAGELSPAAEAMPLVAALWEKALYYDNTPLAYEDVVYTPPTTQEQQARQSAFTALGNAGVLPQAACTAAAQAPPGDGGNLAIGPDLMQTHSLLLYQGALALSAWAQLPIGHKDGAGFDPTAAAESYVAYLGLDALSDWQPAHMVQAQGMQTAALYSPGAQLLAQVVVDSRYTDTVAYTCGVFPLTREAFQEQNTL